MKNSVALLVVTGLLFLTGCETDQASGGGGGAAQTRAYTPSKGSPEHEAIMDGTRQALARQGLRNVVLGVPYLKVHRGWAWIQVNPQSWDGSQRYESQSGLLQKKAGEWTLLEWMPAEEGTDSRKYFKEVKARYPSAPTDIFPK